MELQGKVALVTGGAVRLGRALALALAAEGARVAVHYAHSAGPAEAVVAEITSLGSVAVALQADLGQTATARSLVERAVAHFGQVDVLVNNAAIFEHGDWDDTTEENWDRHFAINLKAPFFLSQAFAMQVGRERRGHIVNIADWRGVRPGSDHIAYTLTKAGLVAMTQSLALALAPNIQVNAIAPGLILPPPGRDQAYLESKAAQVPARRIGSPEEIAHALLFLLRSDFVTGELVYVTGGEHL
ncbi:MAG TPA: SDR family oxidoreductase [Anaerolineae bacterium]|nr:SDR family oxidoreductase [Anaerolineae bacterium]HQK12768.1 SDR family oxidoreductase [Anaerolineae bacterium]